VSGQAQAAARLDDAIDRLLAQRASAWPVEEEPTLATARLLRDSLPRFHPRFGFEELLARRLAETAPPARETAPPAGKTSGRPADGAAEPVALQLVVPCDDIPPAGQRRRRGLLAGSAIASGLSLLIPIAGAALLAWRRGRAAAGIA